MNTEYITETTTTTTTTPVIAAEIPAPIPAPVAPAEVITGDGEGTTDRRFGTRKTENGDGTVSYGFKTDGTPRKRPGRKPKAS